MTDALRYEWLRIRTIRSTWWLTGVTATIAIAVSFLIALGISAAFDGGSALQRDETALAAQIVVSQGSAFGEFGAPFLLPFVLVIIGCLFIITYFPMISLGLRDLAYPR